MSDAEAAAAIAVELGYTLLVHNPYPLDTTSRYGCPARHSQCPGQALGLLFCFGTVLCGDG